MIAHKYHNQISEFYYSGPRAQPYNFFPFFHPSFHGASNLYGTPNSQLDSFLWYTQHTSSLPREAVWSSEHAELTLHFALPVMTGFPDNSVSTLI